MPLRFDSNGLPNWTLDDCDAHHRKRILDHRKVIFWHLCSSCEATPESKGVQSFRCCAGCAHARWGDKTRYCSEACQTKDWYRYKRFCRGNHDTEMDLRGSLSIIPYHQATFRLLEIKQAVRWCFSFGRSGMRAWVIWEAFRHRQSQNPKDWCLRIDMCSAYPGHPQSPVYPRTFEFLPIDEAATVPSDEERCEGAFKLVINGWQAQQCFSPWSETGFERNGQGILLPQWPWIFAQIALMGDINPMVATVRFDLLVNAVENFNEETSPQFQSTRNFFKRFEAPLDVDKWELDYRSLDIWMEQMHPVVANIGSRVTLPGNKTLRRYRHTLDRHDI